MKRRSLPQQPRPPPSRPWRRGVTATMPAMRRRSWQRRIPAGNEFGGKEMVYRKKNRTDRIQNRRDRICRRSRRKRFRTIRLTTRKTKLRRRRIWGISGDSRPNRFCPIECRIWLGACRDDSERRPCSSSLGRRRFLLLRRPRCRYSKTAAAANEDDDDDA